MSKIKIALLLLLVSAKTIAQIAWQPSFDAALKLAQKQNKTLMVECYHPTCPHCIILNKNLENKELIKFINSHYVSYKLNLSKPSDVKILDSRNIHLPNFPMILYFSANDELINYQEPTEKYADLFKQFNDEKLQTCADCDTENGNAKLLKCAMFSRIKNNFVANDKLSERIYNQIVSENMLPSIQSWQILKRNTMGVDNSLYKYWVNNLPIAAGFETNANDEKSVIYNILMTQLNQARKENKIADQKLQSIKDDLLKLGSDNDKILLSTWDVDLLHKLQQSDFDNALKIANQISDKYPNGQSQIAIFSIINKNTDSDKMNVFFEAKKQKTLVDLKTKKEKLQFYEQAAQFYYKARQAAECLEAIKNAQQNGLAGKELADLKTKCGIN